jgi:hypothetical protein
MQQMSIVVGCTKNGDSVLHVLIAGKDNAMDHLSCRNIMGIILWKSPFIILHRNNQKENCLDHAKKVQVEDFYLSDDYDDDYWFTLIDFLQAHMHMARIHMYKYLMNDKSDDFVINFQDDLPYSIIVERATLNELL